MNVADQSGIDLPGEVGRALSEIDLTQTSAWADLDALATHVFVDGLEVDPSGIVIDGPNLEGVVNLYVTLQYGRDNDEGFSTSASFLGRFRGHLDKVHGPKIEDVTVDTSPHYE